MQVMFLLRLLCGWVLSVTWPVPTAPGSVIRLVGGAVAWLCIMIAVYLLNGVGDVREDSVNTSPRPIAQRLLAPTTAVRVVWTLAVLGVVTGFVTSVWLGLSALCVFAVGWWYSVPPWRLKRRSSGAVAAALTGVALTYYAGAVIAAEQASSGGASGVPLPGVELLVFGGALSLWTALVGGSTKDLPDVAGDEVAGMRSWLSAWGERRFRYAISAIALLVGGGFVAVASGGTPRVLPAAVVLLVGAMAVTVLLLTPLGSGHTRAVRRRPYRGFMVTQYVAHCALAVGVASEYVVPTTTSGS